MVKQGDHCLIAPHSDKENIKSKTSIKITNELEHVFCYLTLLLALLEISIKKYSSKCLLNTEVS